MFEPQFQISMFTTEGRFLMSAREKGVHRRAGEFNSSRGVAVGETGAVFLSDSNHNRLQYLIECGYFNLLLWSM